MPVKEETRRAGGATGHLQDCRYDDVSLDGTRPPPERKSNLRPQPRSRLTPRSRASWPPHIGARPRLFSISLPNTRRPANFSASIVIAVERANNSSKGTRFTNSSKKHRPPRHGSGPGRFEISSQLIADAEQPKSRA
jgi:hypothetical protein